MNRARTIKTAITTTIAITLLVGCSSAQPSTPNSDLVGATSTSTSPSPSPTATIPLSEPGQRPVEVVSVIDPLTLVVTPTRDSDELYGTEFTVHINDIVAPASTECGYEETLTFAQELVPEWGWSLQYGTVTDDIWIDENGEHYGFLSSNRLTYGQNLVRAGLAHLPKDDESSYMDNLQREAQAAGVGHWTTCPGFGM